MKVVLSLILFVVLVPALTAAQNMADQNITSAADNAANLRMQLIEVQARESELQTRERELTEAMQPDNIARSLAGVGSTRPEELREQVGRELSIQRDGVRAQLKLLATSRERLESAVRFADSQAYQQSAEEASLNPLLMAQALGNARWLIAGVASLLAILGVGLAIVMIRRTRTT